MSINPIEIKTKIAKETGCGIDEIKCFNCKKWGYNRGREMTSIGSSKCSKLKRKTDSFQFCRLFERVDK